MNYKKMYKKAFKEAEKIHNFSSDIAEIKRMEQIFPELSDNKDELIKNRIIKLIKMSSEVGGFALHKWEANEMLAWLEKQGQQKCLDDVAKEVTKNKETAMSFLKSCGIMNANGELADEYKIEQGEQKPADKVELKFKVGDWVVFNNKHQSIYQVEKIEDGYYILRHTHGGTFRVCVLHDESLRLWNITKDAKLGDVIYLPNGNNEYYFFIFKGIENAAVMSFAHFYQYNDGTSKVEKTIDNHLFSVNDVFQPATKEQRSILFKRIKEAGYEWDDKNKELKKIEDEPENYKQQVMSEITDLIKEYINRQKPTWSEEDDANTKELIKIEENSFESDKVVKAMSKAGYEWSEETHQLKKIEENPSKWGEEDEDMIQALNAYIDTAIKSGMNYISFDSKSILIGKVKNWLKSIKDRVQHKQELSEEDNKWIKNLIQTFEDGYFEGFNQLKSYGVIDWLKSMKDRVLQKQEWSEEDEDILNFVIARLHSHPNIKFDEYSKEYNWLKSLKGRVHPKHEWGDDDEHRLKDIIYFLDTAKKHYASTIELDACIDWLKSINDRVLIKTEVQ